MSSKLKNVSDLNSVKHESGVVVSLKIYQDGNIALVSPLHPKDAVKALQNVIAEIMFRHLDKEEDRLVQPISGISVQ